jgi:hypothetical protein
MGLIQQLAAEIVPCDQVNDCLNSPANRGEQSQCHYCKLAVSGGGPMICWKPWKQGMPHAVLVAAKQHASRNRNEAAIAKRKTKSRPKQALYKKAVRAEKTTERNFNTMASTVNSGRSHKDGDHVLAGRVTLDTKMQSGNSNPVVNLAELDKVRGDAKRAGNLVGALVLRNKHDRGVVVLDETDYAILFTTAVKSMARELVNVIGAEGPEKGGE